MKQDKPLSEFQAAALAVPGLLLARWNIMKSWSDCLGYGQKLLGCFRFLCDFVFPPDCAN